MAEPIVFHGPAFPGPSIDKNGHIFVTVEFVPMSERMPAEDVAVLLSVTHVPSGEISIREVYRDDGQWVDITGLMCTNKKYVGTHWAEMPKTKV